MNKIISRIVCVGLIASIGACGRPPAAAKDSSSTVLFKDLNQNGTLEPYEDVDLPIAQRSADLVSRMTLEQKIGMSSGNGFSMETFEAPGRVDGAAGYTFPLDNLGIPAIVLADGPAGLRIKPERDNDSNTYYATAFPIATLLASSWDVALVEEVGQAMGNEVKEYGVDLFLAPGMNIHRNPRAGRNFEYYSEDPLLSGKLAAAIVNGVESNGVGATIKHFVANNQETNRFLIDVIIGERALREIYLRGFEIAVKEARPWAIMSAYNQVNGSYASQNNSLLTTVLRDEWGFEGLVMTDWFSGNDPVAQIRAGNNLLMPGLAERTDLIREALASGSLSMDVLNRNVAEIVGVILGSPSAHGYRYSNKPDLAKHAELARKAAAAGAVLLKNDDGVLPLSGDRNKIAVFGNTSYELISGGSGSGDVNEAYTVSLVQGMANQTLLVDENLRASYGQYLQVEREKLPKRSSFFELTPQVPEMVLSDAVVAAAADTNDVALITIGRNSGEHGDRHVEGDVRLNDSELEMIRRVSGEFHAAGKPVVLVLNIGNVVEVAPWRDSVDTILLSWQGGQEAGNAIADILVGTVNPSGKLATTFPFNYTDEPSAASFPGIENKDKEPLVMGGMVLGRESSVTYDEGIYTGYRYFDSFKVPVAYEFGYGLSYTHFTYSQAKLSSDTFNGGISASIDIRNTGEKAGQEVVQLYLTAPGRQLDKPIKELKGFSKTALLKPRASQHFSFDLDARALASFDPARSAWVAEAGEYTVLIGASSRDIKATLRFTLPDELIVETTNRVLLPRASIKPRFSR